jgi:hypothetical protein
MRAACRVLVVGWGLSWFALVNKSGTIAPPNYALTLPLLPTSPHKATGYAPTLTLGLKLLSVIINELKKL